MRQYRLTEDKRLPKIPVRFSDQITNVIEDIDFYNQFEYERLTQWYDFLEAMISRISERVIAWDYTNKYQHDSDGTTHIQTEGYNVSFTFEQDKKTRQQYMYIINADLKIEEYGLKDPSLMYESHKRKRVTRITESHIRQIIRETIRDMKIIA